MFGYPASWYERRGDAMIRLLARNYPWKSTRPQPACKTLVLYRLHRLDGTVSRQAILAVASNDQASMQYCVHRQLRQSAVHTCAVSGIPASFSATSKSLVYKRSWCHAQKFVLYRARENHFPDHKCATSSEARRRVNTKCSGLQPLSTASSLLPTSGTCPIH